MKASAGTGTTSAGAREASARPITPRRRLVMTGVFFGLGVVFGFASLLLGPLGLVEAVIVLGLVFWQARRFPERIGGYLLGLSLIPLAILWAIVARVPACGPHPVSGAQCYTTITIAALVAYAISGLAGAALIGFALRRMRERARAS